MLQIYLLGPIHIENDGVPLPRIATQKATSLLGYLVTFAGLPRAREQLAELFWPERPVAQARRSLNTALWQIRHTLKQAGLEPDQFLTTSGTSVAWEAATWRDVAEFEAACTVNSATSLQRALSLYRGPFLDGLYDNWCIDERYRLEEKYLNALLRLAEINRGNAEYPQVLECARRILQVDPLREDAQRLAMEALYQTEQRAAALAQYDECVKVLRAELKVEPSQETRSLHDAILRESLPRAPSSLRREPGASPAPSFGARSFSVFDGASVPFVGRTGELSRLQTWWQQGREPLALIAGEAGVGKTRLTQEFAAGLQRRGINIGWGRGYAFERALPYQSIAGALRGLFAGTNDTALQALPPWITTELVRLLPELDERLPVERTISPPSSDRSNLFEAVGRVLVQLAHWQPILIVLDDLHWSTESTQALLEYLVRRLPEMSGADAVPPAIRLLATVRREELMSDGLRQLLRRLQGDQLLTELNLERLDFESVAEWIGRWSGRGMEARACAEKIYQETEGNPFFIIELIKALFESDELCIGPHGWEGAFLQASAEPVPLPLSVRSLIEARVERLPAPSREALEVVAVAGREFDQGILQAAWGRTEEETLTALDNLLRAQLIRDSATGAGRDYEFTHHKIQEATYQGLPRAKRITLHRRVGQSMASVYGAAAAAELLYHFREAGERARAVEWGVVAGQHALRLSAFRDAVEYFNQSESLLSGAHITPELEMALFTGLAEAYDDGRAPDQLITAAEHLLALARRTSSVAYEVEALMRLGNGLGYANDPRAREVLAEARVLAEHTQDERLPQILYRLGVTIGWPGQWDEALPLMEGAVTLGKQQGNQRVVARALNGIAIAWRAKTDLGRSIAAFEEGIALNEATGNRRTTAAMLQNLGETYALLNLAEPARHYIVRSHDLFTAIGIVFPEDIRLIGVVHQMSGNFAEARRWMLRAYELCLSQHDNDSLYETYRSYCLLLLDMRDGDGALKLAEEFTANAGMADLARNPGPTFYRGLAYLSLGLQSSAEQDLVPAVRRWVAVGGNLHLLWRGYAALGQLYAAQGRSAEAHAAYSRALELIGSLAQNLSERPAIRDGFLNSPPVHAIRAGLSALPPTP